jgi:hypothetical protein
METKSKTTLSYIPANFLLAPILLRWGAKALKTAVANDNFDDDPPPSASAPIPKLSERETEHDAELPACDACSIDVRRTDPPDLTRIPWCQAQQVANA